MFQRKEWNELRNATIRQVEKIPHETGNIQNAQAVLEMLKKFSDASAK